MRATGGRTSSTGTARRLGLMAHATRASTRMARRTAMVDSTGPTGPLIRDSSSIITYMALVFTPGQMAGNIMAIGSIIRCTDAVCSLGQTAVAMKESTTMIGSRERASSPGPMDADTREAGSTASSTALAYITPQRGKLNRESGVRASASAGLIISHLVGVPTRPTEYLSM